MTSYVAFLRGINLGPHNKISMPELRAAVTELGFGDVATYINSGNVVLTSGKKATTVESAIHSAIKDVFGLDVDVTVRTPARLKKVLSANPYPEGKPSQVTVAFLTGAARTDAKERVAALATEHEPFTFAGSEVYVHYADGIGNSKLAARFSAVIGVSCTVRNLATVAKVTELADGQTG